VSEFRSEFRDIRQRLEKHDDNMNLNLPVLAECPGGLASPQHCSNCTELNRIDNSTQTIEMETIEIECVKTNQHTTHCPDTLVDTINDQYLNNSVLIMHNTTPLASEINDDNTMEIYKLHTGLTPEATSIDYINREQRNLTQQELHTNSVNENRNHNLNTSYHGTYNIREIGIPNCPEPLITAKTANNCQNLPANDYQDCQPIPTRITQRKHPKINYRKLSRKHNKRYNSLASHDVEILHENRQSEEVFRVHTRRRDKMKFYQYYY
jgi:hypothetical protein